jgi:uncharacterized protein (TIGR04222 family)
VNTWGISGSAFLALYGGALAATALIVLYSCRRVRRRSADSGLAGLVKRRLSPYEAAMLKGEGALVLMVAACRLKEAGSLATRESGVSMRVAGPLPTGADPVEAWVYDRFTRDQPPKAALDASEAEPVLAPIRQRLWVLGLMLDKPQRRAMRRRLLWFVPVLALGAARILAGVENHRPVGFLVLFLGVGVLGAFYLSEPTITTRAGAQVLAALERNPAALSSYGFAGEVALSGTGALWAADAALATALGLRQGSSGGGIGGGGCGGGGCGGGCGG